MSQLDLFICAEKLSKCCRSTPSVRDVKEINKKIKIEETTLIHADT